MFYAINFRNIKPVINIRNKVVHLFTYIHNFKETHKTFFMNCAIVFVAVKIGLVLLATFSMMALLLSSATQYLAIEMSKYKAFFFAIPLTGIIVVKLYFIFKMLANYQRSRVIIKSAINVIFVKGSFGMKRIKGTFPASQLSLEKVKSR